MPKTIISLKALLTAASCAGTDRTRSYLNGVYVHTVEGDDLPRYVATDGHRLCQPKPGEELLREVAEKVGVTFEQIPGLIISTDDIKQVKSWYNRKTEQPAERYAILEVFESGAMFALTRIGQTGVVGGKAIDGTYPDYERVIPRDHAEPVTAEGAELGSFGFNARYLADVEIMASAYSHPKTCTVKFKPGRTTSDPCVFVADNTHANDDGGTCLMVLMPMRL